MALIATLCVGCMLAPSKSSAPPSVRFEASPERCASLDDRQSVWGAVGAGSGLLAGASGLTTIAVPNDGARLGMAITSAVLGAVAAGAEFFARDSAKTFVREGCGEAEKLWPPTPRPYSILDAGATDAGADVGHDVRAEVDAL